MQWLSFLVVAGGVFLSTLDSSMINVALPAIMRDFQTPLHATEWVVLIYLLTITGSLLLWGHLSDRVGRGRIYAGGLTAFGIGALACAEAPHLGWLIAARFCQAAGAAMMMATGPAIVKESFPKGQIGRGLGLIGIAVSLGLMAGPSLSGFLVALSSWRAIFVVSALGGLLLALGAGLVLPRRFTPRRKGGFDWLGAFFWTMTLTMFSLCISQATAEGWPASLLLTALAAGTIFLVLLLKTEARVKHPLLPLSLFRKGFFRAAMFSTASSFVVLFAALLLVPFYLDRVRGFSSLEIGLTMVAIPLVAMVVAPTAGRLSDRIGARLLTTGGLLLATLGVLLLATLPAHASMLEVGVRLGFLGWGQAMFLSPNSASVLGRVAREQTGAAAALLATSRNLGMLLGIAQAGLVFSMTFGLLTGGLDMRDATSAQTVPFLTALHLSFLVTAGFGLAGALVSWLRK